MQQIPEGGAVIATGDWPAKQAREALDIKWDEGANAGLSTAGFQDADAYDRLMGRWSRRLVPLLIGFGGLADGERIVDVGCGTGSLTFAFPTLAKVAAITGIDATEPFVVAVRARSTDPRITFDVGDVRALP